jgi:hypothetical protein
MVASRKAKKGARRTDAMTTARPPVPRIAPSKQAMPTQPPYRSFATAELSADKVEAIAKTRMHPRHRKLNALLRRNGG